MKNELARLKNGSDEAVVVVSATMISLKGLLGKGTSGLLTFYDLTMLCRDPKYKMSEENMSTLKRLSLLESTGLPHDSIKNVVLSAVVGEGMKMSLISPYADEQPS